MMTQTFEIKVALLGYVSVGKSTVLNALLQDKFSEVSMRRTTAGVNFFRVVAQTPNGQQVLAASASAKRGSEPKADVQSMKWSALSIDDKPVRTATSTHTEISQDNKKLREEKSVQEKTFNVELNEPLCEMRNDTTLVFVDIPGLNEAGSKQMYLNYVSEKWDTFDCVVIVMDAEKGVNTEEQVDLLKLVKLNLEKNKNIPVIVLCNKVDDPDDDELMELVGEVRTKVQQIFKVGNRNDALRLLLDNHLNRKRCALGTSVYPVFIPLSAGNAFAYRKIKNYSLEEFKNSDLKLIDKIGRDEFGRTQWKNFNLDKKYKLVFTALSNAKQYQEHLEATNFDKFLAALSYSIGGQEVQRGLLDMQIQVSLRNLSAASGVLVSELRSIYNKCKSIGVDPGHSKNVFWTIFKENCTKAMARVTSDVDPTPFSVAIDELMAYRDFALGVGWTEQESKIVDQIHELVGQQVRFLLEKERDWTIECAVLSAYEYKSGRRSHGRSFPWDWTQEASGWRDSYGRRCEGTENPATVALSWKSLTYHDWATIIGSLLLMSSNRHFCERFGGEKMLLERLLQRHSFYGNCLTSGKTSSEVAALSNIPEFSKGKYVNGKFVPDDPVKYSLIVQVVAPERISDRAHWGHLIWKFGLFMEGSKSESSTA